MTPRSIPAVAPRRGAVAVLLLVLSLLLVAGTLVSSPAEAVRKKSTRLSGWSTSQLVAEPGQVVRLRVGVRPASRRLVRTVSLQWRSDSTKGWRTIVRDRTDRRGVAAMRLRPVAGTLSQIRLSVAGTRRAAGFVSAPRALKALAEGASTAPVATAASLTAYEAEVLRLTNEARGVARSCGAEGRFAAVGPVRAEATLTQVSRAHSLRMGREGFFAHRDPSGKQPWDRANAAGYHANSIGENIAAGYDTPAAVVRGWLGSDGHCANLMGPRWTEMGIGHRVVPGSDYGDYWTQMFGTGAVRR